MSDQTNYSRQQTVGGSRIGSKGTAIYELVSPFGNQRADMSIISVSADGACQVWLSDNITELQNAGSSITVPTDIPSPSNLHPIVFAAANCYPFEGFAIESTDRVYMLVSAGADNVHAWVSYKWEKEAVRLDFYNAVFKTQEASARVLAAAEELKEKSSWLDKLRQIPAPWTMPGAGAGSNKPERQPQPILFQQRQATQLSPGQPDIPRNKRDRLTRG